MANPIEHNCAFCGFLTYTRGHHIVPKSKGGTETVQTCPTCESFIHKTWDHKQLRDVYNTVESILATEQFQKFLTWRRKQPSTTVYSSDRGNSRTKHKYR
jgi:hypothetical protein